MNFEFEREVRTELKGIRGTTDEAGYPATLAYLRKRLAEASETDQRLFLYGCLTGEALGSDRLDLMKVFAKARADEFDDPASLQSLAMAYEAAGDTHLALDAALEAFRRAIKAKEAIREVGETLLRIALNLDCVFTVTHAVNTLDNFILISRPGSDSDPSFDWADQALILLASDPGAVQKIEGMRRRWLEYADEVRSHRRNDTSEV